ncbi:queuosine precursor transporter [[Clostridium] colinum]|uniref:queuosine precursor transporter n=1 Tax=[Clostridium] colinum TaxID=36835 RepID=UPI002024404D|nr:queuosine precursor transporter [[Clostridium] colinum]
MLNNEILLILSIFIIYGMVLLWFYIFGDKGLLCFTVFATIAANIEVLLVIKAFSLEQTLGNVLFGASFLATDMLSEFYGKKSSKQAVIVGILTSIFFIILSQSWLLYDVVNDLDKPFKLIFSNTPRIMISSIIVYAISQFFDVWVYHKWWSFTEKISGDKRKYLWLRNNASTLTSQLINSLLFTFFAFYGLYDIKTLISIFLSSYFIFIITSILDTPVIYISRFIHEKKLK